MRDVMRARGLTLVHPFDDWEVIHGQGTAARELLLDDPSTRMLVTPCGGGGLLSGTALAAKARDPRSLVVGVEPERADDAARTLKTRQLQRLPGSPDTIADGVRPVAIGARSFEVMVTHGLVDDIVTVSEDEIAEATSVSWLRLKLALEPTGALPLAAHLAGKLPDAGGPIGLILSGGNADPRLVSRLLAAQ
jgi:threonine dehydratase